MHHLYPLAKGDPLCPLGFHPQVRWPTRCKRCFRDYKEHGGRKKDDDFTASTPSLSWNSPASRSRDEVNGADGEKAGRGWASSTNLSSTEPPKKDAFSTGFSKASSSWTSTPDLGANENDSPNAVTVSLKLPKRRLTGPLPSLDTGQNNTDTVTLRRPSPSPPPASTNLTINKNDSLAERVRKMQLIKAQNSFEKESSMEKERERRSLSRSKEDEKPPPKPKDDKQGRTKDEKVVRTKDDKSSAKDDLNFLMQVKNSRSSSTKPPKRGGPSRDDVSDDETSTAGTATTEATLVDANVKEYQEQIESLKSEMDILKKRCERVEKEKSDILLRRLANIDTANKYTTGRSSEVLKLQQKVNELNAQNEDLRDEKKHLALKVKEIECELESRPSMEAQNRQIEQLRAKLVAAETLCEELMDENEDMKKELRDLEEEIEEMQDNFREDQADEYSSLRRELEQTIKNCRVLSFKLKKTERRADQLEQEKSAVEKRLLEIVGGEKGMQREKRIKELEQELSRSTEVSLRLQREVADVTAKLAAASGAPPANLKKTQAPVEGQKVSRASLTRGGSQEDPAQLLRDLQDSLEREADLREQLRNAEEEANNLRKTASRVEDDNESLLLQLKKMATKARSRKLSPTPPTNRLAIEAPNEKDEGISDEEDPAELRLLLELNEQEAAVLRRKVEETEQDRDSLKKQVKELTEKIANTAAKPITNSIATLRRNSNNNKGSLAEEKVKVLEDEIDELRKKLIEKERDCERLHAELSLAHKKPKGSLMKSKSLDGSSETVDLKRQLQVIEQEASVLRAKTQSLEADNEKLQAENKKLQLLKNAKSLKTDKSLELNASKITTLEKELKDATAKIKELEASKEKEEKSEKKVRFGGEVTKKEADSLKQKQEELDKLKLNFNKLEKENEKLRATAKLLKEDAIKSFKPRSPKKPTDLTTKLQMKKMVEDLESEIGEMYVIMKNAGISSDSINAKTQLEKDIEEVRSKLSRNESEFTNEKNRMQTEIVTLKDLNYKIEEKYRKIETDNVKVLSECKSVKEQKLELESKINKLNNELKSANSQQSVMSECMKKIEDLKKQIDVKDKEIDKLKKQVETVNQLEQDKNKLLKEVGDKSKKIVELEKKLKESDEKSKRNEKLLSTKKDKLSKLEKELSEEKEHVESMAHSHRRLSVEFTSEKDELQTKLIKSESKLITLETEMRELKADYDDKITHLESTVAAKDVHIKQLEDALREASNQKYDEAVSPVEMSQMQEKLEKTLSSLEEKEEELTTLKLDFNKTEQELSVLRNETNMIKASLSKLENEKKDLENKIAAEKKESSYWESKASELETDLQAERKKLERMRIAHDKDNKNKEAELGTLKGKLKILEQSSGAGVKKISELKQEHEEAVKKLEHSLAVEKAEYEELTCKYEMLEEEHVVTKARLTVEKEQAQGELLHVQKELNSALSELKSLQNNYDTQSSAWTKERSDLQSEISSLQERLCGGGWEVERARLTARLDQRERELKDLNDQRDVLTHHHEITKKELEESRQNLEDYERVSKIQRNLTAENVELEREVAALNNRLEQADKARKGDLVDTKIRYEGQMNTMREELKSLHNQVSRFRRERDNYKQMLDAAQKTMAEMKSGKRIKRNSISSADEEEYRNKLATLEQQVACLEDELCESRLNASKLNTELVSERSTAEVKLAEMQSKLNEYEEERLLSSGRARVAGLGTRMELAWHKERDEQHRLLQETSTLARDLRQTLYEVERERDKERLDMKRRIEQLKKTTEEETEDAKKKVSELQCDLLELRDAHAKLRTANEKLRRDKERHDRDRDQNKLLVASLKRAQQEDDRVITQLLDTIEDLMKQSPGLFPKEPIRPEKSLMTPTPPRRNRSSKSRSRSATPESSEASAASDAAATAARLMSLTSELKASRIAERQRRQNASARRAMSTEPRDTLAVPATRTPSRAPSLKKRSVSLEQTTKDQNQIWKSVDDSSVSSMQSLDGDGDNRLFTMQRDASLDSRLSGGSTQSDVLPTEKKKKKGLFGKLKKLTKSRSIDDQVDPEVVEFRPIGTVSQGSDSDMSAAGSKRDLRGRLSDMFSRKGPSRANSKDKSPERAASAMAGSPAPRSMLRNASSNTLRLSSTKTNEVPSSRASSATPAARRKGK